MNRKYLGCGALLAMGLSVVGCDHDTRVEREIDDLRQAQRESPDVVRELEEDLNRAKAEVVRLEEELALAKQGITRDVLEQRKELKDALDKQTEHVKEEVREAQQASRRQARTSDVAERELEKATPTAEVKAQVHTETQTTPTGDDVQVRHEQTNVPVETSRVIERTKETPIDQGEIERRRELERQRSAEAER